MGPGSQVFSEMTCARENLEGMTAALMSLVTNRRDDIRAAVARHRGRRVRVFGSAARGDEHPGSDIDLLVDFEPDSSLFDLIRLSRELEELLGHPVDIVSAGGLKDRDWHIVAEAIDL